MNGRWEVLQLNQVLWRSVRVRNLFLLPIFSCSDLYLTNLLLVAYCSEMSHVSFSTQVGFSPAEVSESVTSDFPGCMSMTPLAKIALWKSSPGSRYSLASMGLRALFSPRHHSSFHLESFSLSVAYVSTYFDKYQLRLWTGWQEV